MDDIPRLLQQWGLSQYIAIFEANNITLSTLSMLDNYLAKELITPVGDRARFLKNLQNWKKLTKTDDSEPYMSTSTDAFVDVLNPSHKKILTVSDFLNPLHVQSDDTTENFEEVRTTPTPTNNTDLLRLSAETASDGTDDENVSCTLPLKSLLMKSNEGQVLLNLYLEEEKLSNNQKAQEIKDLFKKENISTFFIPYIYDKNLKIKRCAKGKLYDCLQNRRRELRDAKIIKINKNKSSNSDEIEKTDDNTEDCENCTEPWHTVMEKWQRTARQRLNDLSSSNTSIDSYLTKFPILRTTRGHELMTADFNYMYPSLDNKLYENFPLIKEKLFKLALAKCQLTEVKEILEQYQFLKKDNENYEEVESILAFMLIPLLLGNPAHKGTSKQARSKGQVWRPSKAEVKDGFITHVTRPMDGHPIHIGKTT